MEINSKWKDCRKVLVLQGGGALGAMAAVDESIKAVRSSASNYPLPIDSLSTFLRIVISAVVSSGQHAGRRCEALIEWLHGLKIDDAVKAARRSDRR